MKILYDCIFKGIEEKKAIEFTNSAGSTVSIPEHFKINVDEIYEGRCITRQLRINREIALNVSKNFKLYDPIIISLDVYFVNNNLAYKISNVGLKK